MGGLVGSNDVESTIIRTYATGSVTAADAAGGLAGGLVGQNRASLTNPTPPAPSLGMRRSRRAASSAAPVKPGRVGRSFWDSTTTLQPASAGGGTPQTTVAFQNTLTFMALAEAAGWSFTVTWSPPDPGHYPELYSISPVIWADVGDVTGVYGSAPTQPVAASGGPGTGPGTYVFDTTTTPPVLPLLVSGSGVGTHTVTAVPTFTSAGAVSYRVFSTPGTRIVTPAALTITANDRPKLYGQTASFAGSEFTAAGLVTRRLRQLGRARQPRRRRRRQRRRRAFRDHRRQRAGPASSATSAPRTTRSPTFPAR